MKGKKNDELKKYITPYRNIISSLQFENGKLKICNDIKFIEAIESIKKMNINENDLRKNFRS